MDIIRGCFTIRDLFRLCVEWSSFPSTSSLPSLTRVETSLNRIFSPSVTESLWVLIRELETLPPRSHSLHVLSTNQPGGTDKTVEKTGSRTSVRPVSCGCRNDYYTIRGLEWGGNYFYQNPLYGWNGIFWHFSCLPPLLRRLREIRVTQSHVTMTVGKWCYCFVTSYPTSHRKEPLNVPSH